MEETSTRNPSDPCRRSADSIPVMAASPVRASACLIALLLFSAGAAAQQPRPAGPTTSERLRKLEDRVSELEQQLDEERLTREEEKAKEKESQKKAVDWANGIITLGNVELKLGGAIKINLVDSESEADPVFGQTESPDPHLDLDLFRFAPQLEFPRSPTLGRFSIAGQLDFHPTAGDTVLKETTLRHEVSPAWWLKSDAKIGLDDRFIRPARRTQSYPLTGTAFWRDESVGIFWKGSIGDKQGSPQAATSKKSSSKSSKSSSKSKVSSSKKKKKSAPSAEDEEESPPQPIRRGVAADSEPFPGATSQEHAPFDFASNMGELSLHFSISNGTTLDGKEVGQDQAVFNDLLQDDRSLDAPLSLSEIGIGAGYARDFRELGEIDVLVFYYDDELRDDAVQVLQNELTLRDPITQAPLAGYGDSDSRRKGLVGFNAAYRFEASHLFDALGVLEAFNPRAGDGLRLFYQWVTAEDGDLDRRGWYAQASWRLSNPARWVYLRGIEPLVRFGEMRVDQAHIASLPLTWSRRQLLVGAIVEVARDIQLRAEYAFNGESTGSGAVDNDELLLQLFIRF